MTTAAPGRRRLVWGAVLAALVVAVILLLVAKGAQERRQPGGAAPVADAARPLVLTVHDAQGAPVADAGVYVERGADGALRPLEGWDAATGTAEIDASDLARVVVQARGYRTVVLDAPREDREVVLEPGIALRLLVTGDPVLPGPPYRLYFTVQPDPASWGGMTPDQRRVLVDLMTALAPPPDDVPSASMRREDFGFEVSRAQGEAGVLLPLPGRYRVRWGLLDAERVMWYARREGSTVTVDVEESAPSQVVEVPITTEAVDATRAELDAIQPAGR